MSCLCATFEALIGALYLQNDIAAVQRFVHPMLENVSEQFSLFRLDLSGSQEPLAGMVTGAETGHSRST